MQLQEQLACRHMLPYVCNKLLRRQCLLFIVLHQCKLVQNVVALQVPQELNLRLPENYLEQPYLTPEASQSYS